MELSEDAAAECPRLPVSPLTAAPSAAIPTLGRKLSDEIAAAQSYRRRAKSVNTLRAYESDWRQFEGLRCMMAKGQAQQDKLKQCTNSSPGSQS